MEQVISGREIMLFIMRFRLWDAYLDTDAIIPKGGIDLRAPRYGCDECSFALYKNGKYEIEAWVEDEKNPDNSTWELVEQGDIFDWADRP